MTIAEILAAKRIEPVNVGKVLSINTPAASRDKTLCERNAAQRAAQPGKI